jgi:hypothetical protein
MHYIWILAINHEAISVLNDLLKKITSIQSEFIRLLGL